MLKYLIAALLVALPARAGTIVCALYEAHGKVVMIVIPDNDDECNHMDDGPLNQIRFPLSMFGGEPKTWGGKLGLASEIQTLVPELVNHAEERN